MTDSFNQQSTNNLTKGQIPFFFSIQRRDGRYGQLSGVDFNMATCIALPVKDSYRAREKKENR
jgi:hypothetical protein